MGLRRGEALGLERADVNLDEGRMTIRRALHRVDGQLKVEKVKTEGSVAILPPAGRIIRMMSFMTSRRH
jgi:integrase